jgi:hypothetical protein
LPQNSNQISRNNYRSNQSFTVPPTLINSNGLKNAGYRVLGNSRNFLQWNTNDTSKPRNRNSGVKPNQHHFRTQEYVTKDMNMVRSEEKVGGDLALDGYHNYRKTNFDIFKNLYGGKDKKNGFDRYTTEYSKMKMPYQINPKKEMPPLEGNLEYIKDQFVTKEKGLHFDDYDLLKSKNYKKKSTQNKKDPLLMKLEKDIRQISNGNAQKSNRKSKMETKRGKMEAIQRRQRAQANLERKRKLVRLLKVEGILI